MKIKEGGEKLMFYAVPYELVEHPRPQVRRVGAIIILATFPLFDICFALY